MDPAARVALAFSRLEDGGLIYSTHAEKVVPPPRLALGFSPSHGEVLAIGRWRHESGQAAGNCPRSRIVTGSWAI